MVIRGIGIIRGPRFFDRKLRSIAQSEHFWARKFPFFFLSLMSCSYTIAGNESFRSWLRRKYAVRVRKHYMYVQVTKTDLSTINIRKMNRCTVYIINMHEKRWTVIKSILVVYAVYSEAIFTEFRRDETPYRTKKKKLNKNKLDL